MKILLVTPKQGEEGGEKRKVISEMFKTVNNNLERKL